MNPLDNPSAFNKQLAAACDQIIRSGNEGGRVLATAYFNRGIALIVDSWPRPDRTNLEPALSDLEQAIRLDPKEGLLYTARGYLRHAKTDVDRAIVDYSESLRLSLPRNFVLLTRSLRGNAYMAKGEFDRAIADYDGAAKILATDQTNRSYATAGLATGDILTNRSWAWLMKGKISLAAEAFDDHLKKEELFAGNPLAFYGRSVVRARKGDRAGAERDMLKALVLDPNITESLERVSVANIGVKAPTHPSAFIIQYASHWATCRDSSWDEFYEKRISSCTHVITSGREQGQALAYAFSLRAKNRQKNKESDHAIADFTEAIRIDPKNAADHLIARADVWLEAEKYDQALADFTEAIRIAPKSATSYTYRAQAWLRIKEFDRAIADYTEAIRIDPEHAVDRLIARADVWLEVEKYDQALADFTEGIRIAPKNATSYTYRAQAWLRINEFDRAIADYTEAIRIDPEHTADHLIDRADVWLKAEKHDQALADFTEAIRLEPKNAWRYRSRARAWLQVKDLDHAIADYVDAIRIDPNYVDDYNERGKALLMKGEIDRSLADFDMALRLQPGGAVSLFGRGLAKLKKGDKAGADVDIAAAKAKRRNIADRFAREGLQ